MPLPEHFVITITGRVADVRSREIVMPQLAYYLTNLMTGTDVPEGSLRGWGVQITVEPDMDQGPEA